MLGVAFRSSLLAPWAVSDRYEVGDILASGGMGVVHRAFDKLAQRWVAYKRLRVNDAAERPRMAARFEREYDTLARLAHPNIVQALDYGFDRLGPYYTMELLEGTDCAKLGPLPMPQACRLLRDVASALSLLQTRRLVHRDLSPRNVFLSHHGSAKLIDFGVLTPFGRAHEAIGTAPFVAPESLLQGEIDQRTDLYGLGALAYYLLTGHPHLPARSFQELERLWRQPVLRPSHFVPELPKAVDDLMLSLLAPEAGARPSSAAQVIEQLTTIAQLGPEADAEGAALSYFRLPPLIGRDSILSKLEDALQESIAGRGQVVVVGAEQGLGRSAVLEHFSVRAQLAGASVLRVAATHHSVPFSSANELVQRGLALFPSVAERVGEDGSQLIRWLMPHAGGGRTVRSVMDASERQTALSNLLEQILLRLCELSPLLLLIDDAHALDAASLSWLASLLENVRGKSILVVLSAQRGESPSDVQAWGKLRTAAAHLELGPLDAAQLAELVQGIFGDTPNGSSLSAWLFAQTAGAPAHSLDLLRFLFAQGVVRYAHGTFTFAHEFEPFALANHQRALLSRLSQVSAEARELASLLALHRGSLTPEQLASARGSDLPQIVCELQELVQRGAAVAHREAYACASEALRAAIQSTLTEEQARARHQDLARALTPEGAATLDETCAVVDHLLRAGEQEQLRAAKMLARVSAPQSFEASMQRNRMPMVESALAILGRHGYSDWACITLLGTLSLGGYFRDPSIQGRYRDRALSALSRICGLDTARRLTPWLGPRAALALGLVSGFVLYAGRPGKLSRHSFVEHMASFAAVTGTAIAAAACTFDAASARHVLTWLEPLAVAPANTPLFVVREICRATAELVSTQFKSCVRRYLALLNGPPLRGLARHHAAQIQSGCLNGLAQALVSEASSAALLWADRCDRDSATAFYAPHTEGVRAVYYAYRGEAQRAARHRERAEALALKAGTCWSSTSVLAARLILPYALTGDVLGLLQLISDLEPLARVSPSLSTLHELAKAHLALLQDAPEQALASYERIFASQIAQDLPTYAADRSFQVLALLALGRRREAQVLGQSIVEDLVHRSGPELNALLFCIANHALARVELALGATSAAAHRLDTCLRQNPPDSPLLLGTLHRERARVAAAIHDLTAFDFHAAAMTRHYRATQNPLLVQQCAALQTEADRSGIRVISATGESDTQDPYELETLVERPR